MPTLHSNSAPTINYAPFVLSRAEAVELLELGSLAPSGGNIQPWRARISGNRIDLSVDQTRSNSMLDVGRLVSVMALGSFLENMSIGAERLGLVHDIDVRDIDDPEKLTIRITFVGRTKPRESML